MISDPIAFEWFKKALVGIAARGRRQLVLLAAAV